MPHPLRRPSAVERPVLRRPTNHRPPLAWRSIPHEQEKQHLKTGGSHNRKSQPLPGNKDRGQNR